MKQNIFTIARILFGLFCLMIGLDKFLDFLGGCTLQPITNQYLWMGLGVLQIATATGLLLNKYVDLALKVAIGIFIGAIVFHIFNDTFDVGGAIFGALAAVFLLLGNQEVKNLA